MNRMTAIGRTLPNAFLMLNATLFIFIGIAAVGKMYMKDDYPDEILLLTVGVFIVLQLFLVFVGVFRLIDKMSKPQQYVLTVGLFFLQCLLMALFLWQVHPAPAVDYYVDVDSAVYLLNNGAVTDGFTHYPSMSKYGNNYFFIILLSKIIKGFQMLGIGNYLLTLRVLNAVCIEFAVLFLWLFVKETQSLNAANKALVVSTLSPMYYCYSIWVYTITFSLPLMMLILYLAVRLYRTRNMLVTILLGLSEGFLCFVGYSLRPTAIFPAIAVFVLSGPFIAKHKAWKKTVVALLCAVVVMVPLFHFRGISEARYFSELQPYNYPVTHWISMGSHDTGRIYTSQKEEAIAEELKYTDDINEAYKINILENYKKLGLSGTIHLWARKTIFTWNDGYNMIRYNVSYGETSSGLIDFLSGERSQFFKLYCYAFHCLLMFSAGYYCLLSLRRKRERFTDISASRATVLLSVGGGFLLYLIWEAQHYYCSPFLILLFSIEQESLSNLGNRLQKKNLLNAQSGILYALCLVLMSLNLGGFYKTPVDLNTSRITSTARSEWAQSFVEYNDYISQDFYCDKAFNDIFFQVTFGLNGELKEAPQGYSSYRLQLTDENGKTIRETTLEPSKISDARYNWSFDRVAEADHYVLNIEKLETGKASINFYTESAYYCDLYNGTLKTDVQKDFTSDLKMNVSYIRKEVPRLNKKELRAFILLYALAGSSAFLAFSWKKSSFKKLA